MLCSCWLQYPFLWFVQMRPQSWSLIRAITPAWCRSRWVTAAWPQRRSSGIFTAPCQTIPPFKTPPASLRWGESSPPTLTATPRSDTVRYLMIWAVRCYQHSARTIKWCRFNGLISEVCGSQRSQEEKNQKLKVCEFFSLQLVILLIRQI